MTVRTRKPHTRKPHTLESKKSILASSINASTKAQKKKIDKLEKDLSLPNVTFAEVYMYQNKKWQHKGKTCMLCSKMMNDSYVIENHHYVCETNILKHRKIGTD